MAYPTNRKMRDVRERFYEKVDRSGVCWLWTASKSRKGYGQFGVKGRKMVIASRFVWELERGEIPAGMCVLHRCDMPSCVNVEHLFLGTKADNNEDMRSKGRWSAARGDLSGRKKHPERWPRGSQIRGAKLTETKVRAIRKDYMRGVGSFVMLGRKYGVGKTTVERIIARKKWAHVQ